MSALSRMLVPGVDAVWRHWCPPELEWDEVAELCSNWTMEPQTWSHEECSDPAHKGRLMHQCLLLLWLLWRGRYATQKWEIWKNILQLLSSHGFTHSIQNSKLDIYWHQCGSTYWCSRAILQGGKPAHAWDLNLVDNMNINWFVSCKDCWLNYLLFCCCCPVTCHVSASSCVNLK